MSDLMSAIPARLAARLRERAEENGEQPEAFVLRVLAEEVDSELHLRGPEQPDPILSWLTSAQAAQYRNHWVALSEDTGSFLGLADELPDLRRWQAEGAVIVFVDPPSEA